MTFFSVRTYFHLMYLSLFKREDIQPSHRRSVAFCLFFLTVFAGFEIFTAICLLLDEALFWRYRRIPLREPIFVIGNPRSGTTILHRVLACDDDRFVYFRSWEILFPSILQKKVLSGLGRLDRAVGSPLGRLIERFEASRFEKINRIHEFGLFQPEEDDKLLLHILVSPELGLVFPYAGFDALAKFDLVVDPAVRRTAMEFYANCIRRQAYFKGAQKTPLSKSPWASARVDSLARQFPDGKFIYLGRNPLDVVASIISFVREIHHGISSAELTPDLDEAAYETVKFFYLDPLERLAALPAERYLIVNYDDLLAEPRKVFEDIYEHFDLAMTPEFEARLDVEVAKMLRHKSRHNHSLEGSSVTRERILADLQPVFDRFGFDRRERPRPASAEHA